jgi:acyl-coenzyme A thioesterase PaaI-like protein
LDFESIREGLERGVPFNAHVGLVGVEVGAGHAIVRLPGAPHLSNHIGTQHGSAIFAAAEASSGAAVFGALAAEIARFTPLAERGEINFHSVGRGPLDAEASLADDPAKLLETADREGRVRFTTSVEVRDQKGNTVATASFDWLLRRNERPQDWTARATNRRR